MKKRLAAFKPLPKSAKQHKKRLHKRRPYHKKVLLHPITVFFLFLTGVALVGLTFKSFAADITVTAKVPAEVLTEPAIIESPTNGSHTAKPSTVIAGTCPANSYVELLRNDLFSGTAGCISGHFEVTTDLFPGLNNFQAQDYNFTDDKGPDSSIISIYYDEPAVEEPSLPNTNTPAFTLLKDTQYQGVTSSSVFRTTIQLVSGTPPYKINVNWGDGVEENYVHNDRSPLELEHAYTKTSVFHKLKSSPIASIFLAPIFGSATATTTTTTDYYAYTIMVTATDSYGSVSVIQLVAIVNTKYLTPATNNIQNGGTSHHAFSSLLCSCLVSINQNRVLSSMHTWVWAFWPVYLILILMTLSFWLGERQELHILASKKRYRRRTS